jgi:hypothetical protein
MNMIAHEHVTMDRARMLLGCFDEVIQVAGAIVVVEKNGATIIAALNDMHWIAGDEDATTAGHA